MKYFKRLDPKLKAQVKSTDHFSQAPSGLAGPRPSYLAAQRFVADPAAERERRRQELLRGLEAKVRSAIGDRDLPAATAALAEFSLLAKRICSSVIIKNSFEFLYLFCISCIFYLKGSWG